MHSDVGSCMIDFEVEGGGGGASAARFGGGVPAQVEGAGVVAQPGPVVVEHRSDEAAQHRVLVENPAKLYDFPSG